MTGSISSDFYAAPSAQPGVNTLLNRLISIVREMEQAKEGLSDSLILQNRFKEQFTQYYQLIKEIYSAFPWDDFDFLSLLEGWQAQLSFFETSIRYITAKDEWTIEAFMQLVDALTQKNASAIDSDEEMSPLITNGVKVVIDRSEDLAYQEVGCVWREHAWKVPMGEDDKLQINKFAKKIRQQREPQPLFGPPAIRYP